MQTWDICITAEGSAGQHCLREFRVRGHLLSTLLSTCQLYRYPLFNSQAPQREASTWAPVTSTWMTCPPWTLRMQRFTSPKGAWVLDARVSWVWAPGAKGPLSRACEEVGPISRPPRIVIVGPFACSDSGLGARRWSEPSSQKSLRDPNPEHEPEPTLDTVDTIALSLCGGLADSRDISLGMFDYGQALLRAGAEPRGWGGQGRP